MKVNLTKFELDKSITSFSQKWYNVQNEIIEHNAQLKYSAFNNFTKKIKQNNTMYAILTLRIWEVLEALFHGLDAMQHLSFLLSM